MSNTLEQQRYQAMRTVTVVGAGVNIILALGKVIIGFISQSHALITDGIHSFSDLATDAMVLFAAKHSNQSADAEHPYGHARIETAFTVALGLFLVLVAVGIMVDAGRRVLNPALLLHPGPWALVMALFSIVANEGLYRYTMVVAKRVRSPLLRANAWHHRSDAISSVVVLVGVAGALFGLDYLDAFASVGVALMVAKIGWDLGWNAVQELVDTGLEPEQVTKIHRLIHDVEGVKDLHMLRTRRMGGHALVDVHVQVNPRLSVSEGHQIGEYVRTRLLQEIEEVADVTVHIDPEDDRSSLLCENLPLRREILAQLRERWASLVDPSLIRNINLHYLSGKIHVELILSVSAVENLEQAQELAQALRHSSADIEVLAPLQIYFT